MRPRNLVLVGAIAAIISTVSPLPTPQAATVAPHAASVTRAPAAVKAPETKPADTMPGKDASAEPLAREAVGDDDATASRNAARSRMHECGHQWSTAKKNGTAGTMTWKEFSQTCLARK